jgi:putative membrane protein
VRRAFARHAFLPIAVSSALLWYAGGWALLAVALGVPAALLHARMQVRNMGHGIAGDVFLFRSGWIWRHVTLAPLGKVQAAALVETPFDRRHGMAALVVDTAGARGAPHRLAVPWLDRAAAAALASAIAAKAAESTLRW